MQSSRNASIEVPSESPSHALSNEPNLPLRLDHPDDPLNNPDFSAGSELTAYDKELAEVMDLGTPPSVEEDMGEPGHRASPAPNHNQPLNYPARPASDGDIDASIPTAPMPDHDQVRSESLGPSAMGTDRAAFAPNQPMAPSSRPQPSSPMRYSAHAPSAPTLDYFACPRDTHARTGPSPDDPSVLDPSSQLRSPTLPRWSDPHLARDGDGGARETSRIASSDALERASARNTGHEEASGRDGVLVHQAHDSSTLSSHDRVADHRVRPRARSDERSDHPGMVTHAQSTLNEHQREPDTGIEAPDSLGKIVFYPKLGEGDVKPAISAVAPHPNILVFFSGELECLTSAMVTSTTALIPITYATPVETALIATCEPTDGCSACASDICRLCFESCTAQDELGSEVQTNS